MEAARDRMFSGEKINFTEVSIMTHAFLMRNGSLFGKQNLHTVYFSLFMPLNCFHKGFFFPEHKNTEYNQTDIRQS